MPDISRVNFTRHAVAVIALFLLGNSILYFPKVMQESISIWALVICLVLGVPLYALYARLGSLAVLITPREETEKRRVPQVVLCFFFVVFAVLCLYYCCNDYLHYINRIRLPNTPGILIFALFAVVTFVLGNVRNKVIYLMAMVSLIFVVIVLCVMLLLSIPNMRLSYFLNYAKAQPDSVWRQALIVFAQGLGQGILAMLFLNYKKPATLWSVPVIGYLIGAALLLICFFNTVFVLGYAMYSPLDYPYATVTSMISYGNAFCRLDGFTYYIYFVCSAIKAGIIIFVIQAMVSTLWRGYRTAVNLVLLLLLAVMLFVPGVQDALGGTAANGVLLVLEIGLPPAALLLQRKAGDRRQKLPAHKE